mmetsp:Transcript_65594/g.212299  ORF Transcript_65594/g.212299 Transcript_65594/m.212299 type:complete len:1030 (+) Transcript_65594:63-3152(+)
MDDFERAIRVVFTQDPSISPQVREQATKYIDAVKARPDSWRFCWEQFLQRECLEVKFWCLQVLPASLPQLPAEARAELRVGILAWLRDVATVGREEVAIRNKIALVYAGLVKSDYPSSWPTAWTDLISFLDKGPHLIDMFLRVLTTFDQEVISEEVLRTPEEKQRAHTIKHAMREGDVARLAECWFVVLGSCQATAPQLVSECLKVVAAFAVWVEATTLANEKFLGAICSLIGEGMPFSGEACDCLGAVLSKKMPAGKKMQMLDQLRILHLLGERCIHRGCRDVGVIEKEAELFNTVAEVVLDAYLELRVETVAESARVAQAAWSFVEQLMVFVLWFFSHQDYQIADSVEPFLTAFFSKVRVFCAGGGEPAPGEVGPCHSVNLDVVRPMMQQTLQLTIQRLAYPDWFRQGDPDYEDDEQHIAFLEFRRSLTKIYKRIFLVDEQMGFMFIQASIAQLTQNLASVRPMEVEALLYLYTETGEIVKDVALYLKANGALAVPFVTLVECEALVEVEHWLVQLALMDVYVRYARIFAQLPELMPTYGNRVLRAFVGPRGVRSNDRRVVARACYMFARFIRTAKKEVVPFTADIYEALKDLLVVQYIPSSILQQAQAQAGGSPGAAGIARSAPPSAPAILVQGALKVEDQACLFEALASLVAALPASEHMRPALRRLLEGPVGTLAELSSEAAAARIASDPQGCAAWAARSVDAIGTVSKGFARAQACSAPDWAAALQVVGRLLEQRGQLFDGDGGMSRSTLFLCRRMVDVLGDSFLGPMDALLPFLYASSQADLLELTTFAHQVVCQHQKKTQPLIQKWLHVLFLRPLEAFKQLPEDSEQLKREKFELGTTLLLLLKEIAQRCPVSLLEPMLLQGNSSPLASELVGFLLLGLKDPQELKALLYAASAWSALLELASAPGSNVEALAVLPLVQILQQLLWSIARMDFRDIASQKVLGEAAAILRALTSKRRLPEVLHQQAMEALRQALVAALPGLRSEQGPRALCEALLQEAPLKDVRVALQQCASDWLRDCGIG